ncbi:MAG: hypothetical protein AAFP07_17505 [Cyanobacteria bacterium J06606_4]
MSVPTVEFATASARAEMEQLMQPALIRVIDNIRKQLEDSSWQGTYEEDLIWPDGTTSAQKQEYATLQNSLHGLPPEEHDRVAALMSNLPQPTPLYTLRLTKAGREDKTVDIWRLCYRICAKSYAPGVAIEADSALFDEQGEVDWRSLDDKTKKLIDDIFAAPSDER